MTMDPIVESCTVPAVRRTSMCFQGMRTSPVQGLVARRCGVEKSNGSDTGLSEDSGFW